MIDIFIYRLYFCSFCLLQLNMLKAEFWPSNSIASFSTIVGARALTKLRKSIMDSRTKVKKQHFIQAFSFLWKVNKYKPNFSNLVFSISVKVEFFLKSWIFCESEEYWRHFPQWLLPLLNVNIPPKNKLRTLSLSLLYLSEVWSTH